MKLSFLKIDKVYDVNGFQYVDIPAGGLHIWNGYKTLALRNHLTLELRVRRFQGITRDVEFDVYMDESIQAGTTEKHSVINLLAVDGLVNKIYQKLGEIK